jgi:uncharacterized coiled-coil DUF342 family protein
MVDATFADITALITGMTALIGASAGIAAGVLNFMRSQTHSERISELISKASNVDGQIMHVTKAVQDNKDKIDTMVDITSKLAPQASQTIQVHEQQIKQLTDQINQANLEIQKLKAAG